MYQEYYGSSNDGNDGENIKFSYFYQCIQQFINTNIIASINTLDEAQENSPSILQHFIALIKIYDDENIKSDENIEMDYSRFTFGLTDEAKKLDESIKNSKTQRVKLGKKTKLNSGKGLKELTFKCF